MSTRQLLDQLLQQGQALARGASQKGGGSGLGGSLSGGGLGDLLKSGLGQLTGQGGGQSNSDNRSGNFSGSRGNEGKNSGGLGSLKSGFGGGALSGGALGVLLGNKKLRKSGGKIAMYGGMAALGLMAYKAYGNWQKQQAGQSASAGQPGFSPAREPQTMDRLPAPEVERHCTAVLAAMIGAAKADGHIGNEERALLHDEIEKMSADPADRRWLDNELSKPLDPAQVAAAAQTPEMAAEMYLASLIMVDEESYMERAYLDELARQLKLEPGLKTQLEAQVREATA